MGMRVVQTLALYGLLKQLFAGGSALLKSDALPTFKTIAIVLALPDVDSFKLI